MRIVKNKPPTEPLPEGAKHAVIPAIGEVGEIANYDNTKQVYCIAICFEFVKELGPDGKRRTIWKRVAATGLHPKSTLGKIVSAAGITVPIGEDFDPRSLVGKNLVLLLRHKVKDDGSVFAEIDGYAKLGRDQKPETPQHPPDAPMPDWLRPKPTPSTPRKAAW